MKILIAVFGVLALMGCGNKVIVDPQGLDQASYERDLAECETYADEVSTGQKAGAGAVIGAAIGAAIGAILGNTSAVARSAGVGAVVGGAQGTAKGENEKDQVLRNCLRGRGYKVLN